MKPDWKNAPKWARWLALDGDGYWCWFEHKPEWDESENMWMLADETPEDSKFQPMYGNVPDESGIDWDFAYDTLEKRP